MYKVFKIEPMWSYFYGVFKRNSSGGYDKEPVYTGRLWQCEEYAKEMNKE